MKKFMDKDFLLSTDTAVELYEKFAKDTPIIDYHCHLVPAEIAENNGKTEKFDAVDINFVETEDEFIVD